MNSVTWGIASLLVAVLAPATSLSDPALATEGWRLLEKSDEHGHALYARPRAGSEYDEYRMEVVLDASPDDVIAALLHNVLAPEALPDNYERKLVRRERDAIISHDYIKVPFLADRDAVMRTEVDRRPESGEHVMRWYAIEGEGPAPAEGVVRMPSSTGSWTLAPREDGGTRAIYESHVELGGSLPRGFVAAQTAREIVQQALALRRTLRARSLARN